MIRSGELFSYLAEREQVRLRKEAGQPWPWTDDPILQKYKFTNVRREDDATSRELITRHYHTYGKDADAASILLNCAIARYFGRWEFAAALGWQTYDDVDFDWIEDLAAQRRAEKKPVFTGAYVITNGGIAAPKEEVVTHYYLKALHAVIPDLVAEAQMTNSWRAVAKKLMKVDGFGGSGFMAKETLCDTTYTAFWPEPRFEKQVSGRPSIHSLPGDWWSWTPCGPGARRGMVRVLGHDDIYSVEAQSMRRDVARCEALCNKLSEESTGRLTYQLAPHDIQFALCEFDKYERVRLGQGTPRSTYKRR